MSLREKHTRLPGITRAYARIASEIRVGKEDLTRVHIIVWGNLIDYCGDVGTPTADLITVKLMINHVISTSNAKFTTLDVIVFKSQHSTQEIRIPEITFK